MRPKPIAAITVFVLVVSSLCVAGCTVNLPTSSPTPTPTPRPTYVPVDIPGYLDYTNHSAGIGIQYPPSWNVTEGGNNTTVTFSLALGTRGVVVFGVMKPQDLSKVKSSLDEYSQSALSDLKASHKNFTVLSSSSTSLAGYPAKEHVVTDTDKGVDMKGKIVITVVDNTGYANLLLATKDVYPDYVTTAQNMMQSFYIIGK